MKKNTKPTKVYEIKITLKGTKPPIWRRVQVRSNITLATLHHVIQIAMGWENYHLHMFTIHETQYIDPGMVDGFDNNEVDERKIILNQVAAVGDTFLYEYDFGDDWEHTIKIEKAIELNEENQTTRCIKGKGACPPEDCGGLWGYYGILEKLAGPPSNERSEIIEWLGGEIDPEEFDLEVINKDLAYL